LKLAVACFALSIVLILVGTLAQVNRDIWEVLEVYFKVWWTWVDVPVFFPRSWAPQLEAVWAVRMFVAAIMLACGGAATMTWANASCVRAARPLAIAILTLGFALSLSSLWTGGFWFPGGALIGSLMTINLLAAHLTRYRIQARGPQLVGGAAITLLGILVTWLVIASGHNAEGFQGEPAFAWTTLWWWVKAGITLVGIGLLAFAVLSDASRRRLGLISGGVGLLLVGLSTWLWSTGDATYLGDSGMRVLWQLIQALVAGVILLVGCLLLFRRRAGVIVLHAGIGLMMFGQWFVGRYDAEEQITMAEGQTINYAQDIRSVELAVIDHQSPDFPAQDDVLVIPLTHNGHPTSFLDTKSVTDDRLPFKIEILDYQKSSSVEMLREGDSAPVDTGNNRGFRLVPARPASGAMSSDVELASGYFRLLDKRTNEPLGTYLLSQKVLGMRAGQVRAFDLETVAVDGKPFDMQLRFVRNYKDYTLRLIDVRKDDYLGTTIPRNYSSQVQLADASRGVNQELTIWMNNPRRYAGETFYQSGYQQDALGGEYTTLQVVRNHGWMIPYVACMICVVGMGYHFSLLLLRFLDRQGRAVATGDQEEFESAVNIPASAAGVGGPRRARWIVPLTVAALFALLIARIGTPPRTAAGAMDLYQFGQLPLVYQGRVKPFDTLARNSLRVISEIETFNGILPASELAEAWPRAERELKEKYPAIADEDLSAFKTGDTNGLIKRIVEKTNGDLYAVTGEVERRLFCRQPATRWLLDVITWSENARRHKVFRVYHPQVLDLLGLPRRPYYRYSLEEIFPKWDLLRQQVMEADQIRRDKGAEQLSLYQKKILETDRHISIVLMLRQVFGPPELPALPTVAELHGQQSGALEKLRQFRQAVFEQDQVIRETQPPLVVPPSTRQDSERGTDPQSLAASLLGDSGDAWQAFAAAWPRQLLLQLLGGEPQPAFQAFNGILLAYIDQNAAEFNDRVASYQRMLTSDAPKELRAKPSAINSFVEQRFGSFYQFESYFNHVAPFLNCSFVYLMAFVLQCVSWLKWRETLNRAAFWLLVLTFAVHTVALVARIYISGRPPVTNLYSSAVFIGWGVVLLALVMELFFRNGLASLVAAASGFLTLLIAYKLAGDGDTFEVLQAVLDTQFWLATHVVCITLGYATTFLAGLLGMLYIGRGVFTPSLDRRTGSDLTRMIYGTLCFAIFFSFVGTVLGGLWADDSWGRFWGWDPKENGALIIVLWNALILHARWDKMIAQRGLAVLAVAGNIVTAWSWFGVNELGVGLHSYGFTEGRLLTLALAILAHLVVIAIGWLPTPLWWSHRQNGATLSPSTP
jgi:ABC-type transport system involved in cytochrome c biogenesis permease subunit